jgi:hypothetical protein
VSEVVIGRIGPKGKEHVGEISSNNTDDGSTFIQALNFIIDAETGILYVSAQDVSSAFFKIVEGSSSTKAALQTIVHVLRQVKQLQDHLPEDT